MWRNRNPYALLVGMHTGVSLWRTARQDLVKGRMGMS